MIDQKPNNALYAVRGVNPHRLDAILKFAGKSILDVGCGSGAYVLKIAREYPQYKIKGVDYQYFETWEQSPGHFVTADAFALPFTDNSFETITLFEVLEHLPEPEKALREYLRVCSKNLILTVPNCVTTPAMKQSLFTYYHYTDNTHVNFFTMDTLLDTVKNAGFSVEANYYINELSFEPVLSEAFDFSGFIGKILKRNLLSRQRKSYYITCLLVAAKR